MNAERLTQIIFELFMFLLMVFALVWVLLSGWKYYSALMPAIFAGIGVVLTGAVLLRSLLNGAENQNALDSLTAGDVNFPDTSTDGVAETEASELFEPVPDLGEPEGFGDFVRPMVTFIAWLAVFYVAILIIGFLPAVALATVSFLRLFGKAGWLSSIFAGVVLAVVSYYFYDTLMHVRWPESLIVRLIQ